MYQERHESTEAVQAVRAAFADTRPQMTLGEFADAFYGTKPNALVHQARHWSEVTAEMLTRGHFNRCDGLLLMAPDEVWLHYAPALMVLSIEENDYERSFAMALPVLQMICPVPETGLAGIKSCSRRAAALTPEQVLAVRAFVKAVIVCGWWDANEQLQAYREKLRVEWAHAPN